MSTVDDTAPNRVSGLRMGNAFLTYGIPLSAVEEIGPIGRPLLEKNLLDLLAGEVECNADHDADGHKLEFALRHT